MKKIFLIITCLTFLFACKKEDEPVTPPPGNNTYPVKDTLLTGGSEKTWKISKYGIDTFDLTDQMDPCEADNLLKLKISKDFEYIEQLKCDPSDPDTESGEWKFDNSGTKLIMKIDGEFEIFKILELTENKLHLRLEDAWAFELTYVPY